MITLARLSLAAGLALLPHAATAQVTLTPLMGFVQYDGANDDAYLAWSLRARYQVSSHLRVGLQGTTAHIGIVPYRNWTTSTSDQRIWRASGFAEAAVPLLERIDLAVRAQVGVFHSSGVTLSPDLDLDDPFVGFSNTPTGIAYGAGLGLEYVASRVVRVVVDADLWRDHAYGGWGFNPDLLFGVSFAL